MSVKCKSKFNLLFARRLFFMPVLILASSSSFGQIVGGELESGEKDKKTKEDKRPAPGEDSLTGTNFYLSGLYQYTYRDFEDGSSFGYYKDWEDQTSSYNKGISAGLLMDLSPHFQLDIGISYFGNGENHTYKDSLTDSSYTYENTYIQLAVPLRIRYVYGEKWQFFAFAGLAPLNILKVRYESSYFTETGVEIEREPEIRKDGFASFNLMLSGGIGLCYNLRYVGFMIYPEYRRHLLNTYSTKTISMNHRMYGYGINAGLVFRF